MANNLKDSLEGAGIGLFGGLLIGITKADWLRLVIVSALLAYAGKDLLGSKTASYDNSYKTASTWMASFFAMMIGLYLNGQHLFRESTKEAVSEWINAGYGPAQARVLYLKQHENEFQKDIPVSPLIKSFIQNLQNQTPVDSLISAKDRSQTNNPPIIYLLL